MHEAVPLRETIRQATRLEQRISSIIVDRAGLRNRVSQPNGLRNRVSQAGAVASMQGDRQKPGFLDITPSPETRFLGITRTMFQVPRVIVPI
jgi:hypothetical protein